MVGQQEYSWWAWADLAYIYQATVQIDDHDTMAEVALGRSNFIDDGEDFYAGISILQVVSSKGTENFSDTTLAVWRQGMTSLSIQVTVISAFAYGRLMLNYWS